MEATSIKSSKSNYSHFCRLVVEPTHLKNMSQIGSSPQVGLKIEKYLKPPASFQLWRSVK